MKKGNNGRGKLLALMVNKVTIEIKLIFKTDFKNKTENCTKALWDLLMKIYIKKNYVSIVGAINFLETLFHIFCKLVKSHYNVLPTFSDVKTRTYAPPPKICVENKKNI